MSNLRVKIIECKDQSAVFVSALPNLLNAQYFIHQHDLFAVDHASNKAIWLQNYYRMNPPPLLTGHHNVEISPLAILSLSRKATLQLLQNIKHSLQLTKQSAAKIKQAIIIQNGGQTIISGENLTLDHNDTDTIITLTNQGTQGILTVNDIVPHHGDIIDNKLLWENKVIYYHDLTAMNHDILSFNLKYQNEDKPREIQVLIKVNNY